MRPDAMADSMPLTSFGADAEMRWTLATGMSATRGFEMIAHGALKCGQRGGKRCVLRDAVTEAREQVLVHGGVIDAEHTTVARNRPAVDDQLLDVARGRAREQEVERVEIG